MYERELQALQRAGRFRKRRLFSEDLRDFASNDYLGLAHDKDLLERAYQRVRAYPANAAKASQLINGYTPLHAAFEERLKELTGFAGAITVGSGFLANLALIESLVRKGDRLFLDSEFHASGNLAARLVEDVVVFPHNDPEALESHLRAGGYRRAIVAVEGIYSMSGDRLDPGIMEVANSYDALLIIDEAHSVGVVGERLLGVCDGTIRPNYIKMGTLGKALGSYGAYILAQEEIISFLENRAKGIIYTTALSLMDVALGWEGLEALIARRKEFQVAIAKRQALAQKFGYSMDGLILDIPCPDPIKAQERLLQEGYLVGAIRPPTTRRPILRIIARLGEPLEAFHQLLERVDDVCL
ncbi:MAG: 8-amino-7-oxononanoate synthase [Nitratiruptor sp.]|nr:8-amino-7-oxononanoate synthase [Nitratiruptor sp.]NPA83733.1 aminotransferase class I/II-fold pyridoxal phosphate-dependent enzyme [Campylobacterota bacterium]